MGLQLAENQISKSLPCAELYTNGKKYLQFKYRKVRIPAHREHPFWLNVNTYSGPT
jgi:hypothetical protein